MAKLFLVRHGESVWNNRCRYQGQADIQLSDTGRLQARLLAERLKKEKITDVYSSDLKRAYDTANILAAPHNLHVQVTKELRDINFGVWEGLSHEQILSQYGELAKKWYMYPAEVRIPGGETFVELKERAYNAVLDILRKNTDGTIIVTHGFTILAIICGLLEIDLNLAFRLRQDNTALNIIEYNEGSIMLSLLNDINHLQQAP